MTAPARDGGQQAGGSREGRGDGTWAAIGAAAIFGIAALAHSAHHHGAPDHDDDPRHEADDERGDRDALHGYRADSDRRGGADGHGAGLRERSAQAPR